MTSKNKQRGFLSLDMAIGLLVFGVVVTLAMVWQIKQMDGQDYRIAADQQRTISEAQAKYLKDNFNVVLANASATVPVQITVPMLISTNYLPAGFSSTNVFGQTILGLARKPNPNQLEAIVVTTGGQTLPEMGVRAIAENLGGPGGFISTTNPNVVQGIRGGWQVALSNYSIAPGPGHTASALFLMDGALANDYLYRNAVPNHPELNTMNTDLGMGNHNINNAGSISASGNVTTGADVTARNVTATANVNAATANVTGETYTGGWFRTRGDTGWYSEKWGGGIYQNSPDWVQVYNDKNFSTGGQLWGGKITSTGRITAYDRIATNEFISVGGLATEGSACSDRTLIAKSAVGIVLSCQNAVWKGVGGAGRWGGSFWTATHTAGGCPGPNPYTGSCSCPVGYKANNQFAVAIGGCNPCVSYSCYKDE
ncbi:shufflon system plasmid conjugative transfer pilus tip adhesin PilV [Pseudomonas sp. OST1909]|uniref:shufflon system plasmid conjugative transfer pilus tip adhesin PilV n=1 Tax=Pseudomonas sp. OST1909 TaxID=2777367 RepID=UPI001888430C|nr:shufflon system plasmid conjugative transfer pilus tip adhesin PilV [Pseudomonas sp. OST1909]QOY72445.1 shufflon system plasmid conjugative transfer pilus tip adhesin PilV [Pseudomonas sp. OST1909]